MTDENDTPGNVHKLELVTVGEGFRFDPDAILEAAKGQGFNKLVIIADYEDPRTDQERVWISGTANAGESMILMEIAKLQIIEMS